MCGELTIKVNVDETKKIYNGWWNQISLRMSCQKKKNYEKNLPIYIIEGETKNKMWEV